MINNIDAKCTIVGAGDFFGLRTPPKRGDLLIAADGGLDKLSGYSITPDIIMGDFDSIKGGVSDLKAEIIRFPKEKDDTDMMLAVKEGLVRGYKDFRLYGGTGGRVDHFTANMQTLVYIARHGAIGWLYGEDFAVTAITDGRLGFNAREGAPVSIFAADGTAYGVTLSGLYYELSNAALSPDFPLGVSNKGLGGTACVEVKKGALLIVIYD